MAKEKIKLTDKEIDEKLKEMKLELLKQTSKRKVVKRTIARLLTAQNQNKIKSDGGKK